ncbi:hypothetical protein EHQ12_05355 [Leptospira gomenensis]|uniref:DUF3630 family protein n=1 Tax=Leptospira gomenensis TaxID=2484974 RepID=A0A5F1YFL7_9LEPT|nr:hypothetical protein [Leptospira gomenensis]TGK39180.1 hypothetical protein EHQ17_00440 [Leptospira gomenensis]TGK41959.1 hypothetical protein EHQ12_05355 [Leptospira gomenensis]TGK48896.1 hypothetical protein EHQ07_05405 [Leptospira gomenensis]TGK65703.1 hypothetical protein EHQ13_04870 [Leptospira gomenensis]
MKDYSWYKSENLIYLYFNKYTTWDSFDKALDVVFNTLNTTFSIPKNGPYNRSSEFEFENEKLTLVFHEDLGCYIVGSFTQEETLKKIASLLPELKET